MMTFAYSSTHFFLFYAEESTTGNSWHLLHENLILACVGEGPIFLWTAWFFEQRATHEMWNVALESHSAG